MGLSGKVLAPKQMVNQIQTTLAIEILYYLVVTAIKISILCFYLRIGMPFLDEARYRANDHNSGWQAPRDSQQSHNLLPRNVLLRLHNRVSHAMRPTAQDVGFHRLSGGQMHKHHGAILLSVTQYHSHVISHAHQQLATSSISILIDIWILVLPITTLLKIQRPKREKAALVGIFSLGVFSCIASIVRLHSIRIYTESKDPFYDSVPINLWSMVEIHIGVYCASIPACKALFSSAQRHRSQTDGYQYHSQGRSGKTGESGNNGSVRANESYGMKGVESGAAKPQNYLASDSEVDGESVVRPVSRV
jgi:hypothetical protein